MRVVNDRRRSQRVTVRGEALVVTSEGPLRCRCLDISRAGISVVSPRAVRPRQRVRVESSFGDQHMVLDAVVMRRRRSREGHVLGLRFDAISFQAREQLDFVLRSMQVQAALAQQACAFFDHLPRLRIPSEPEPQTERASHVARAPMPTQVSVSTPVLETPVTPTLETPVTPTLETPMLETPTASESPIAWPFGLDDGWTEEEIVTGHFRPFMGAPAQPIEEPVLAEPPVEPPVEELPADMLPFPELSLDALPLSELSLDTLPLPELPLDAPWALPEPETLVDDPPALDRTLVARAPFVMLEPPPAVTGDTLVGFAPLGPVRTGQTLVIHVKDLLAAFDPTYQRSSSTEPPSSTTAPMTMPRLSDELQAALDRMRRRGEPKAADATESPSGSHRRRRSEDASRSGRRKRAITDVYQTEHEPGDGS
jgi:PilZ domain